MEGEEVVGAKQNRTINLSILVPAQAEVIAPVTCVEAGRWHARSAQFPSSSRTRDISRRGARTGDYDR
jgi:ARG and Rhodanese-Phosphatase-superfamily-associated Protein domain